MDHHGSNDEFGLPWSVVGCWKAVTNPSGDHILLVGTDGTILFSNQAAELVGTSATGIFQDIEGPLQRAIKNASTERLTVFGASDGMFDVMLTPVEESGEVVGVAITSTDITEHVKAQAALQRSEDKWRSFANFAVDFIIIIDLEGNILDINRTGEGIEVDDVIGTSVLDYLPAEFHDVFRSALNRMIETGELQTYETRGSDGSGGSTWFSTRLCPFRQEGELVGATLFAVAIADRKLAEERLRSERALLRELLELQDKERQLLSYDIHDGLIQDIVGAQLMHEAVYEQILDLKAECLPQVLRIGQLLRKAIDEGRSLISNLRPPILDERGLVDALEFLVIEENVGELDIEFRHHVTFDRLERPLEGTVYRIVQEALNNVKRHSGASVAEVTLSEANGLIQIDVVDNGSGFEIENVSKNRYGLKGIRERARLFGGQAVIDSRLGQGTSVHVELPFEGHA